jgi:hypothetical protein
MRTSNSHVMILSHPGDFHPQNTMPCLQSVGQEQVASSPQPESALTHHLRTDTKSHIINDFKATI